jgi:shikimate dehydrogenase
MKERRYDRFDVTVESLPAFVADLDATWAGLSLTMPLKEAVLPLLSTVSRTAAQVAAVNTVLCGDDGLHGHNTDVPGFVAALRAAGIGSVASAAILGAGATARSALAALARLELRTVEIVARSHAAIERVAQLGARLGIEVAGSTWNEGVRSVPELVVSTLPGSVAPPDSDARDSGAVLFDVAYEPWPTTLAGRWLADATVIGGLDLLVHQAVEQVRLMTGGVPSVEAMRAAGVAALAGASGGTAS